MKELKKVIIKILCEVGKNGIGKSAMWGMYEIKVPVDLKREAKAVDEK